ncbi:hypothetical protein [Nocardia neocaledoniensis]|uniref:hypothetical protein n=1 Tax=Nocardia neocaledoniensis TaxID=236511 RepID=UPI002458E84E|nr:hypothetical protein [Nocardia neocaledoniensis]
MSLRTSTVAVPGRTARRAETAERVKSGAAQRAYARKRTREQLLDGIELPERASSMAGRIPFVTAIIGLLGCGLALTLLLTTRAAEDSYQLGDARAVNRKLADERAALQREVAAADSAPELAARARELGMIPAKDPARLVLGPGGEVTVIGTPSPAQGAPAPPLNAPPTTTPNGPAPGHAQAQGERVVPVQPGLPSSSQAPAPAQAPQGGAPQAGAPAAPQAPAVAPQPAVAVAPAPLATAPAEGTAPAPLAPAEGQAPAPAPADGQTPAPLAPADGPAPMAPANGRLPATAPEGQDPAPINGLVEGQPQVPAGGPAPAPAEAAPNPAEATAPAEQGLPADTPLPAPGVAPGPGGRPTGAPSETPRIVAPEDGR